MKTARKSLLIVLCAVLLVAASVMGTLAYLTATTGVVTNTFTVGNVSFDLDGALDEADVDEYGVLVEGADRVTTNNYKLIPGHEYIKDPTVHMSATTEDAWLFVKVVNGIAGIEAEGDTTIAAQMAKLGWTPVEGAENVWQYNRVVTKEDKDIVVFNTFKLADKADVAAYAGETITIKALAVQADGLTAAEAWAAEGAKLG